MRKILFLFIFCLPSLLIAQSNMVTGVVKSSSGEQLIGATVHEDGTTNGTITDVDGRYSIKVSSNKAILSISYLGYQSQSFSVGSRTVIDATLQDNAEKLDEIVVVGYGSMKRVNLAGAISTADVESIQNSASSNITEALEGVVPGLQILTTDGEPGATISMRIRGGVSLGDEGADTEPLIIIDGFQGGDLSTLDANEIESLTVLKDAASTAIYGANGSNGVILVTTRSAKKGKPTININSYLSIKNVMGSVDMMSPEDYVRYQYEIFGGATSSSVGTYAGFVKYFGNYEDIEANYSGRSGINWFDELYGDPAISYNFSANVSGGTDLMKYTVSYAHLEEEGVQLNSEYSRDNFRARINSNITKWLSLTLESAYVNEERYGAPMEYASALQFRPTSGVTGPDSDMLAMDVDVMRTDPYVYETMPARNPLIPTEMVYATDKGSDNQEFTIKAGVKADIIANKLVYDLSYNYGKSAGESSQLLLSNHPDVVAYQDGKSYGWIRSTDGVRNQLTNVLNYNTTINEHSIGAMVGQELQVTQSKYFEAYVWGLSSDALGLDNLGLATASDIDESSERTEYTTLSYFSRLNYIFDNRYIVTATMRGDASSRLSANNKWGFFPAASVAWRVSQEEFMKDFKNLNELKLRLSYGITGNARVPLYSSQSIYEPSYVADGNSVVAGLTPSNISNPDLRWERTKSVNLGVDVAMYKNKLNISADIFTGKTEDMLYTSTIPATSGFTSMTSNIGSVGNKGVELSITSENIKKKNFMWRTTFNISSSRTEVLSLNGLETEKTFGSNTYGGTHILRVGEQVGLFYGYEGDGLFMPDDFAYSWDSSGNISWGEKDGVAYQSSSQDIQPGYRKLVDQNNDGVVDEDDRVIIGNANPLFFGGITNKFNFRNCDVSVTLNYSYGNDILNLNMYNLSDGGRTLNVGSWMADRYTVIDDNGYDVSNDPVALTMLNAGKTVAHRNDPQDYIYDGLVEDGSYLRVQNVTIGYTLPRQFTRKFQIKTLRIYASGTNLFCITGYSGVDPSVNSSGVGVTAGIDNNSYPKTRNYVVGVNITM